MLFTGQKLFTLGGRKNGPNPIVDLNTAEFFTKDGWKSLSINLTDKFERHCSVLVNATAVMLIGGISSLSWHSNLTYIFNSKTLLWKQGPSLTIGTHK